MIELFESVLELHEGPEFLEQIRFVYLLPTEWYHCASFIWRKKSGRPLLLSPLVVVIVVVVVVHACFLFSLSTLLMSELEINKFE